jgi:uncharacterized membrane protein
MTVDWAPVARAVHIAALVIWIGGVSLVTTVLLPAMRRRSPERWFAEFERIERGFAPQARIAALLVLLSGIYMLYAYDLWDRFADAGFWWMHLMVGVWLVFAALLFVVEPLSSRHGLHRRATAAPEASLTRILWLHRALLGLSLLAVLSAVGGSHGLF